MSAVAKSCLALLCLLLATHARAAATDARPTSLGEVFEAAQESEPGYRAAEANLAASQARSRQALGAMLPQLSLSASANGNRRTYNTHDARTDTMRDRYHSHTDQLSLTQPLWHPANTASWHEAKASESQATYQLADAEQKLYAKLASAWFDLMAARDEVEFTTAQRDALRAQWDIARRGAELGTQSAPQAAEAEAKYREASADQAAAELDHEAKLAALEQLTGPADGLRQPYLRDDATVPALVGDDMDAWLNLVDTHCPSLRAAAQAIAAADEEIRKQRAGGHPTLDLVASYGNNDQAVGNFPGQAGYGIRTLTVGVQLNVPLYTGGTQSAKVAEALAAREKALAERDAARRQAILDIRTAFLQWQSGEAKAKAAKLGMDAARAVWLATRRGEARGLKTHADVLAAQQQWAASRRDLHKGRYQQITAYVKLRTTLGELAKDDVDELDRLFGASDASTLASSDTPGRAP